MECYQKTDILYVLEEMSDQPPKSARGSPTEVSSPQGAAVGVTSKAAGVGPPAATSPSVVSNTDNSDVMSLTRFMRQVNENLERGGPSQAAAASGSAGPAAPAAADAAQEPDWDGEASATPIGAR